VRNSSVAALEIPDLGIPGRFASGDGINTGILSWNQAWNARALRCASKWHPRFSKGFSASFGGQMATESA